MTVGIVGLGLIGGSMARAYRRDPEISVLGTDQNKRTLETALCKKDIRGLLTDDKLGECDLILLASYPKGVLEWLREKAPLLGESPLVMDCAGIKREICRTGFSLAEEYGFTFTGGHPMAGTHHSGLDYARADLFEGASMVLVPAVPGDEAVVERVKKFLSPVGFGSFTVTDAETHDRMIAFTSQLSHVISSAYVKSPAALLHRGFSGGSFRDLTRVAQLNPEMWTDLFLENRDYLLQETDGMIAHLTEYRTAIAEGDADRLRGLLEEGRRIKLNMQDR